MQVQGIDQNVLQTSSSYQHVKAAAEGAKFSELLKTAQQNMKQAAATGTTMSAAEQKKLKDACTGFEAMFMNLMYSKMRDTVPEDSLFGDSNSDKILQSMLDTEMMNTAAKAGGMGLADMLYKQLARQQTSIAVQTTKK